MSWVRRDTYTKAPLDPAVLADIAECKDELRAEQTKLAEYTAELQGLTPRQDDLIAQGHRHVVANAEPLQVPK